MKVAVIIAAAGISSRFGSPQTGRADTPRPHKLDAQIGNRAVLLRSVDLFVSRPEVAQVIVATNPDTIEQFKMHWGDQLSFLGVAVVPGGRRDRWQTVQIALGHVDAACTHVAIHDGARPLATDRLIDRVFEAAKDNPAVIPGIPVSSTLKRVKPPSPSVGKDSGDRIDDILGPVAGQDRVVGTIVETVSRVDLYQAQTPQVFEVDLIRRAYEGLESGSILPAAATDDASVVEAMGEQVAVVEGEATNLKITYQGDLELAAAIVGAREKSEAANTAKKRLFVDEDDEY